jgi:hypothetical protein
MDGEAVKQLAERFRAPMEIAGNIAYPQDWKVVDPATIQGPKPETLKVYTLGAVRDYLTANRDDLDLGSVSVHVVSPQIVTVHSMLMGEANIRHEYVQASALNLTDGFIGKFMPLEEFIIGLQSRFSDAFDRPGILRLLGSVKQEAVKTTTDDGYAQTVTAKAGVALVTDVQIPNPVTLAPFRTFREVLQPSSPFVLRAQGGNPNASPQFGLFEADGGAWRLVAVDRVRDWLVEALPKDVAVLA